MVVEMMSSNDNVEAFLQAATPRLPWRSLSTSSSMLNSKEFFQAPSSSSSSSSSSSNVCQQLDDKSKKDMVIDYFTLEDLWEHYAESSAYGLSVPVRLDDGHSNNKNTITHHFVPYLSAIQIYTTKPLLALSCCRSSINGSETDSWSDDSIMGDKFSRASSDAMSDDSSTTDGFESVSAAKQAAAGGCLNFQYFEWSSPYERAPLADKVAELAQDYPFLTSLNSAQLSPSSWMSVAWYPIYHIPAHGNLKGTSACFLTYHSISSVFQDNIEETGRNVAVTPFGLATYRAEGKLWRSSDPKRMCRLYWAASSWLKQLRAHHPDFSFFTSRHQPSPLI